MVKMVAQARLSKAVRQRVPRAAGQDIGPGKRVLIYREIPQKWEGPFMVAGSDGKLVWPNVNYILKLFSVDKVELYKPPIRPATVDEGPSAAEADTTTKAPGLAVADPSSTLTAGATDPTGDRTGTVAVNVADGISAAGAFVNSLSRQIGHVSLSRHRAAPYDEKERSSTSMTEVLEPGDPRASIPGMEAAKQAEADGLKRRGVWTKVLEESVPAKANILGARLVNEIKEPNTNAAQYKERYVAQSCGDKDKPFIVPNLSTLRQSPTKVIVSTSAALGWRLFSHDVNQAYHQSKDAMARELYVRVRKRDAKYFELKAGELLLSRKPLYGIADAGDYWDATFVLHVKEDLGTEPLTGDPALFVKMDGDAPEGILGAHVDDSCMGGNEKFQNLTLATLDKFETKPRVRDDFQFIGVSVWTLLGPPRSFTLDQKVYIDNLSRLSLSVNYEEFVRARAAFAWVAHGRPDLCCSINRAAKVTEALFSEKHVKEINKAIKHAKSTKEMVLSYKPLELESLNLRVYAGASFHSDDDMSSQLGYIVIQCDAADHCHVLTYSRKKARRIVRSIMAGEVYAFADAFNAAYMLKHDLERVENKPLPLVMLTDSKQRFGVITRATYTTEKRLRIDVAAAREAYNRQEISNVGRVKSEHNIADGTTNPGLCPVLEAMMRTGADASPVQQWIIRSNPATSTASDDALPTETRSTTMGPLATVDGRAEPTRSDDGKPGV